MISSSVRIIHINRCLKVNIFRTSYLPSEILWGHRFEQMQLYRKDNNKFEINFSAFHSTYEVDTPLKSARDIELDDRRKELERRQVRWSIDYWSLYFLLNPVGDYVGWCEKERNFINQPESNKCYWRVSSCSGLERFIDFYFRCDGSLTPPSEKNHMNICKGDSKASTLQL